MAPPNQPFLTLSPIRDKHNRNILLLHSDSLPPLSETPDTVQLPNAEQTIIDIVNQSQTAYVLLYLHAGLASTTGTSLAAVQQFVRVLDKVVPARVSHNVVSIVATHVSALTRAHVYAASYSAQGDEYSRLTYCDLLEDVETLLGVDSTLLGVRQLDFDYDEEMRAWVHRKVVPDAEHVKMDPSKPLLDFDNVEIMPSDASTADPSQPFASSSTASLHRELAEP